MKADIESLWDTGRELVVYVGGNDTERPQSISDLKKCENVIVGERISGNGSPYEVEIDNCSFLILPVKVNHPCGGGMYILEIY